MWLISKHHCATTSVMCEHAMVREQGCLLHGCKMAVGTRRIPVTGDWQPCWVLELQGCMQHVQLYTLDVTIRMYVDVTLHWWCVHAALGRRFHEGGEQAGIQVWWAWWGWHQCKECSAEVPGDAFWGASLALHRMTLLFDEVERKKRMHVHIPSKFVEAWEDCLSSTALVLRKPLYIFK